MTDQNLDNTIEDIEETAEETTSDVGENTNEAEEITPETIEENAEIEEALQEDDEPKEVEEETDSTELDDQLAEPGNDQEGVVVINPKSTETAHWYVVHTYAGHEKKVAVSLKQRAESGGYVDKIFKVFIPQQQKIVISEGKKRSVNERLFPGYVIVQMDMSDDAWLLVRSTRGVTGFVGMGSTPTPLPTQEVATLMKFATMEAPKFEAKFTVGDSVKIMEGPFKEFLGKVDEVNEDQGKVKVLVSVFGRETPVELDFVQVQNI